MQKLPLLSHEKVFFRRMRFVKISVIIPTLNEALILNQTLTAINQHSPHEVIIADGGSQDDTLDIAKSFSLRIVNSPPGRALQMNAGARTATGELLLFLHADSQVDAKSYKKMVAVMKRGNSLGGAFSLAIESDKPSLRLISTLATLRSKYLHLVYGDQAIFVRTHVFREMGGVACLPICEDLDFFRRLQKKGPTVLLEEKTFTSARRWRTEGIVFTTLRNIVIAALFLLGFPPRILSKWYLVIR
ncbi:MAG: TIGR04283 family arsenosugar biosynthesis glycosyltransferase [Nitrospinae bacterium]|jgi:rSAM/selenodomain-associated transferase 2|nr:TIGR04283 family arsenosugar biosynthesis glycosyltransferase [Nitrospinota bacterium]MDA1108693.1 TIGR04283 family arsenosugar biosynthesis glycosyltransferase [Nitrospinota bacterium]